MSNHSYPIDKCTFELLSAYLDGEVTPAQRKEVQELLAQDPETQGLYRRLLALRQEINSLPIPQPEYTPRQVCNGVFAQLDKEEKQKKRLVIGGGAIAITLLATIGGLFTGNRNPIWQMAQQSSGEEESLMIALNEPLIELPVNLEQEVLDIPLGQSLLDMINEP
ncbi:MAG: anti-sigma factor family protein [Cyanobacterium sp.]